MTLKLTLLFLILTNLAFAKPELIIVGEHHQDARYRHAFDEIVRQDGGVNCIFFEDSPEMDEAAQAYLQGEGSFADTYMRRFFEVNEAMGMSRSAAQRMWNNNYAGRERVLKTAKDRGIRVFHADYTSSESPGGTVRLNGSQAIQWNYIRRHEIMARNISARADICQRSMYLVGENHLDHPRLLAMQEVYNRCFRYEGPALRSLEQHMQVAGFEALAAAIVLNPSQGDRLEILDPQRLGQQELDTLTELDFKTSNHYYIENSIRANLRDQFDRIYVYAP